MEYELSRRGPVGNAPSSYVGSVTIAVPGYAAKVIPVEMIWPAGRAISGRFGEEISLRQDWSTQKLHFGPLDIPLPTIADVGPQSAWASQKLAGLRRAIANRDPAGYPIEDSMIDRIYDGSHSPAWIGPWACWTVPDPGPGAPGGNGIAHTSGWQDNEQYARLACEVEAVGMGRMWCFHNLDGSFYSVDQFRLRNVVSPACCDESNQKPADFGGLDDPADPLWKPIAISHYPRILRYCQAAWEMTGSPLARRHLIQLAETARLQFTECGVDAHDAGYIAFNLTSWEARVSDLVSAGQPHSGHMWPEYSLAWDRRHGWMLWAAAEAKKAGMPWTPGWDDWAARMVAAMTTTQMPNGLFGLAYVPNLSGPGSMDDVAAAMHEGIMGMGLLALHTQVNGGAVPDYIARHAQALYQDADRGPYGGQWGPKHYIEVAQHAAYPAYSTVSIGYGNPGSGTDTGDPIIAESYIAAMLAHTGASSWITAALRCSYTARTYQIKRTTLSDPTLPQNTIMERNWTAFLLAQLQLYP